MKPATTNAFYSVLELTTLFSTVVGAPGMGPLLALLVTIKATNSAIHLLGKASALSKEVACFQHSLEVVKESVERTLEECLYHIGGLPLCVCVVISISSSHNPQILLL
jgi:hypothetical protein